MKKYGMALTTPKNTTAVSHTLSLLETFGDLGELGHMLIECLRMLARDGLEHSCTAGVFPERITILALHVRAAHSFVSSFGRVG